MASTSSDNSIIQSSRNTSSSLVKSPKRNYYDVFVSFRGQDTRYNFTDHLFAAFQRKGIFAFRDDTKLNKGESIGPELLRAIKDSQIFVVILSKNYASSTWCLRELECILQCIRLSGKHVLPVFYDVDPSEVRYQKGSYDKALAIHEERFQQNPEIVQGWREALTQVANLSGWDVRHKAQYAVIEKIVEEVISILGYKFSSLPKDLVGMQSPIEELEKCLLLDSVDDVRVVGICGMGGIGKTTLATVLYNKISHQFSAYCLVDDLSKMYRYDGPISAQKQILCQTLGEEHFQTCNLYNASNSIRSRLQRVKALIILDNVDQVEQLEKLVVNREWLGAGSRIIIICRDEHILKEYGVDVIYKVPLLNQTHSLQLFSRKAFKLDHIVSAYDKLAIDILSYANGLPLAIKVLGSFLFDRNIVEWESALARLREIPNKDIMDVLRLSFDGLEEMEKEIFLHIVCFFNGPNVRYVKNVLNCCGFHAEIGLRVLIDKSLISIWLEYIEMHNLFRELGIKILQENLSKASRKWSRVWLPEQFYNVMLENMEKKVEAVGFVIERDERKINMLIMAETLSKMSHLRLLILKGVGLSGNLSSLSNELRYVEWNVYPFKYLPSSFHPNQLVELTLKYSSIKQLWKDKKYLPNLRALDMSHSKNLRKLTNFGEFPNLERLKLEGCEKLVLVDPSIEVLRNLVVLNLKDCKNLVSIPNNIFGMTSLKDLNLSGCPKVFKNRRQLKNLDSSECSSHCQSTTSSIMKRTTFRFHSLYPKDLATCLLPSLLSLSCLRKLDISFCSLSQLPDATGCLSWLEELNLGGNNFVTLPSLRELSKLTYLNLEHCKLLESLPQLPFPSAIKHDLHINTYRKSKGFIIFNCPKLGEREHCSNMILSWMIQFIQANSQSSIYSTNDIIKIVIPKCEIPIWFNNQSHQVDHMPINLSPMYDDIDNDNNIIGIACCAVFSIAPVEPTSPTKATHARTPQMGIRDRRGNTWLANFPIVLERYLIEVKSDHMCLLYIPLKSFLAIIKCLGATPNNPDNFIRIQIAGNVQSYGYRWVCKQDHASVMKSTREIAMLVADSAEENVVQHETIEGIRHSNIVRAPQPMWGEFVIK